MGPGQHAQERRAAAGEALPEEEEAEVLELVLSPRVGVDLNVHEPHLNKCLATMANWDTAPLLHLAKT